MSVRTIKNTDKDLTEIVVSMPGGNERVLHTVRTSNPATGVANGLIGGFQCDEIIRPLRGSTIASSIGVGSLGVTTRKGRVEANIPEVLEAFANVDLEPPFVRDSYPLQAVNRLRSLLGAKPI